MNGVDDSCEAPIEGGSLTGVKVLDLSNLYAGPLIATTLGDHGADVIKVEHPRGDTARSWGLDKDGIPLWWKVIARNKQLMSLDLNDAGDQEVVKKLCQWADVVIENFRPGRMERWGLGWEQLSGVNPAVIMVRVTGFGQHGPMSAQPGFGTLAEAFSGFAFVTGQADGPPTLPPFGLADGVAALAGAYATMMALYWRDTHEDGRGQYIDLSLYEPLFSILGPQTVEYAHRGVIQQRRGNASSRTAPRNAYQTSDGHWIATSAGTQAIANRIFECIGRPELANDSRFNTPRARVEHAADVNALVANWVSDHTRQEVLQRFVGEGAPIAPINDISQIVADEHYRARESIITVPDPDLGEVTMQGVVPKLSRTPGSIRHTGRTDVGADDDRIYAEVLGMSRALARQPTATGPADE